MLENLKIENEIFEVRSDIDADIIIERMRDRNTEVERFKILAAAKIQTIQEQLQKKVDQANSENDFDTAMLKHYFDNCKVKETKTQKSYNLLSGKLVLKKLKESIIHEDRKIFESIQDEKYTKIKKELDWTKLKEDLYIDGDKIINKVTGEILDIEGLAVKAATEKFEVKF